MISFIWILAWLSSVLLVMSDLSPPVNLTLTSDHFHHTLKWKPGPDTPAGVYYNVTIISETDTSGERVNGCEHVEHVLACDLTEAFSRKTATYFTSVKAHLGEQASVPAHYRRFQPIRDTFLDLPEVTVTSCARDLCVDLQPRMHQLRDVYDLLHYKLRIESIGTDNVQFFKEFKSLKGEILKGLAAGRKYCVSICFSDDVVPRHSDYGPAQCAFTPVIHSADSFIAAALCFLVMSAVIIIMLLIAAGVICLRRRPLPSTLTSIHHIEEFLADVSHNNTAFSSLMHVEAKPLPPSQKRNSQISDGDDGESMTEESKDRRTGDGYRGANLSCSFLPSSSSSLAPPLVSDPDLLPSPFPEPSSVSSSSSLLNPKLEALSSAVGNLSPPADTDSLTAEEMEVAADKVGCVPLPAPSNVSIHSFNMEHVLSFLPGPETPPDTHFTVQIIHLRKRRTWSTVTGCLKLMAGQMCNLTRVLKDEFGLYKARVQATSSSRTSNWTTSKLFEPLSDSVMGPPIVSVSGCGNCLLLQISMPMTTGLQQYLLLQNIHRSQLHVHRVRDGAEFTIDLPYKKENIITYLQPGVEYCVTVSVTSYISSNWVPSKPTCAFTSPHSPSRSSLSVMGLLGGVCVFVLLFVGSVFYVGKVNYMLMGNYKEKASFLFQSRNHGSASPVQLTPGQ